MAMDSYAEAIRLDQIERQLERCAAIDDAFPPDNTDCARRTVRNCCCPCIATEESISNTLANGLLEAIAGHRLFRQR